MAISLFCYTNEKIEIIQSINQLMLQNEKLFIEDKFEIYSPREIDSFVNEYLEEYSFKASFCFLVGLNDKQFSDEIVVVAEKIYNYYEGKVLILLENEDKLF